MATIPSHIRKTIKQSCNYWKSGGYSPGRIVDFLDRSPAVNDYYVAWEGDWTLSDDEMASYDRFYCGYVFTPHLPSGVRLVPYPFWFFSCSGLWSKATEKYWHELVPMCEQDLNRVPQWWAPRLAVPDTLWV